MDLDRLIAGLSKPTAYSHAVDNVEVRQTHISVVFLAGCYAYKLKKPVNFGFLDFSSLPKRKHFCEEEVRLNRRLAPAVYLGVVPVTQTGNEVKVDGPGEVIEWAVQMERLPEAATLQERLKRGEVGLELVEALAGRVAVFHGDAQTNERIAAFGRFEAVAKNLLDIFEQSRPQVGTTVSRAVFERLLALTGAGLDRGRSLIDERARRGLPRDCHGDLHLDHVYYFPERRPPADLVIVDCIEFNERFRYIDPVADMAFPVMDLIFHGRRDLARGFARAYFQASGDQEGQALLPLYTAYRASVRGSVEGLKLSEAEVSGEDRAATLTRARAHWLVGLGELEEPDRRPGLLLVGGLPGTGKSTLARRLQGEASFVLIRSDVVRKELAGIVGSGPMPAGSRTELYGSEWNERTYTECLGRAEQGLFEGKRVIVDATFREEGRRQAFLDLARRWGVAGVMLLTTAGPESVRQRLVQRQGDASDADWSVYLHANERWEEPAPATRPVMHSISTEGNEDQAVQAALEVLRQYSLY